jgi:hypothetical protein
MAIAAMIAVGLTAAAAAPLMGGHCCCLLVGPLFHTITIAERAACPARYIMKGTP